MKYIQLLSISFLLAISVSVKAYIVTGKVVSGDNTPIEFASVFLTGTTCGTSTNEKGEFSLNILMPGMYQLAVSHMSYSPYSQTIDVSHDIKGLVIKLKDKSKELLTVVVKKVDPHRKENLELFVTKLLGNTKNSGKCTILNPRCLYFHRDTIKGFMKAFADSILLIRNDALGYLVKYQLTSFYTDMAETYYNGNAYFEDVSASVKNKKKMNERRADAYYGSLMHFFRSLYVDSLAKEGFKVFKTGQKPGKPFNSGVMTSSLFVSEKGSHIEQTLQTLDLSPSVAKVPKSNIKILKYDEAFEVDYTKDSEDTRYIIDANNYPGLNRKRGQQVSLLKVKETEMGNVVGFNQNGASKVYGEVYLAGYMAYKSLADCLPLDFDPKQSK